MKRSIFPQTILWLALLLAWGLGAAPVAAQSVDWNYIAVSAPLQLVEVQTPRSSFSANLEHVALLYPAGKASGLLTLYPAGPSPLGHTIGLRHEHTRPEFNDDGTVGRILLLGHEEADTGAKLGNQVVIILRPGPAPSEPCRIYDILGTQVPLHFEAQVQITVFRN
jgi:hypothetical protein